MLSFWLEWKGNEISILVHIWAQNNPWDRRVFVFDCLQFVFFLTSLKVLLYWFLLELICCDLFSLYSSLKVLLHWSLFESLVLFQSLFPAFWLRKFNIGYVWHIFTLIINLFFMGMIQFIFIVKVYHIVLPRDPVLRSCKWGDCGCTFPRSVSVTRAKSSLAVSPPRLPRVGLETSRAESGSARWGSVE
jgi:hypothetical protein